MNKRIFFCFLLLRYSWVSEKVIYIQTVTRQLLKSRADGAALSERVTKWRSEGIALNDGATKSRTQGLTLCLGATKSRLAIYR
jgi:hypothetical protein